MGFFGRPWLLAAVLSGSIVVVGVSSCSRLAPNNEQVKVTQAFDAWKQALIDHQNDKAIAFIPKQAEDYLTQLNSEPVAPAPGAIAKPSPSPGVDLLLRTALQKKVPADLRSKLTLPALLQRITERNLFNPRDIREINLGRVFIEGNHATAEVYYQNTLTALRLPFVKEGDTWKIDVLALLPYAEVLMRVDRAIKGETETHQVDRLVSKLPSL